MMQGGARGGVCDMAEDAAAFWFGMACGGLALAGAVALWRRRAVPRGLCVRRYTRLDRGLHWALIAATGAMAVPGLHGLAGRVWVAVAVIVLLRRVARRVLLRRVGRLAGSVARFGRWHRAGPGALGLALAAQAVPGWHGAAGWALLAGVAVHGAMALRDPVALGAMASGFVTMRDARRRYPGWVAVLLPRRQVRAGLRRGTVGDEDGA